MKNTYLINTAALCSGLILITTYMASAQRPGNTINRGNSAPVPSVDVDWLVADEAESNQIYQYDDNRRTSTPTTSRMDAEIGEEDRVIAQGSYAVSPQEARQAGGMSQGMTYGTYYYWDKDSNRWALDDGWHYEQIEAQPDYPMPEAADANAFPSPNDDVVRYQEPGQDDVTVFEGAFETEDVAYFDEPNDGRLYAPLNVKAGHDVIIDLGRQESLADAGIELGEPVVVSGERRSVNGATVIRATKIQVKR